VREATPVSDSLSIALPPELVDLIVRRVVEELEARGSLQADEWLDVDGAAAHMACSRQRVYDLVHKDELFPGRDGRRLAFRRADLDRYLEGRAA
jgi:excisionase family DNA binding protein